MEITYKDFAYYCPVVLQPSERIMEQAQSYLDAYLAKMVNFLGDVLVEALDVDYAEGDTQDQERLQRDRTLRDCALRTVCCKALHDAIPSLDLVLTPTGFGVVSNQNVAPASAERVAALRKSIADTADDAFDNLLSSLRGDERWCELPQAIDAFSSLFWRGRDMLHFGNVDPHRSTLVENRVNISMAEEELKRTISREQFDALCTDNRFGRLSIRRAVFASLCRKYVAARCSGRRADNERRSILDYLDRYSAEFEEYNTSSAYEANHYTGYQNKQDDPCYFW